VDEKLIQRLSFSRPEVLVTHTKEMGQIIGGVHAAGQKIGGYIDIPTALNVAQLALKHRENKSLRQRVIVLAASPVETDQETMVKLAKKLKKNNIAVDIVAFGDAIGAEGGENVLRAFVEAVNSSDNSFVF
jgi:26S proteasome regulatory subunit N10